MNTIFDDGNNTINLSSSTLGKISLKDQILTHAIFNGCFSPGTGHKTNFLVAHRLILSYTYLGITTQDKIVILSISLTEKLFNLMFVFANKPMFTIRKCIELYFYKISESAALNIEKKMESKRKLMKIWQRKCFVW